MLNVAKKQLPLSQHQHIRKQVGAHPSATGPHRQGRDSTHQKTVRASKVSLQAFRMGVKVPASRDITVHYSFDYAQQVHYPFDPMQPGPMYFMCLQKCRLFGVTCEGMPQQVTYLIDEAMMISKGANSATSSPTTGSGRQQCSCTVTIVPDRTKTIT